MSSSDLLIQIHGCETQSELMNLWKTMTECEQKAYRKFFTERKEELNG